ncbi:MAG TPA: c-type cytochrome, partial [Solirubrobacteraceae bacterium]|nr:c-type cytochrome [Solirubrobacteraceae bacterium]
LGRLLARSARHTEGQQRPPAPTPRDPGTVTSRRGVRRLRCTATVLCLAFGASALAGCGGRQSIVAPHSKQTSVIAELWWWMLGAATIVFLGTVGLLGVAFLRRRTSGLPVFGENERFTSGLVIMFGIVIPIVVLLVLFGASDIYAIRYSQAPAARSTKLTVDIVGRQWWWEVSYPGTQAVTANEVHIPTGTRVQVVATTGDVIHSLWVPQLARKIDMIPGYENRILFDTPTAGRYLGQCSEFCGLEHARMRLTVVAEPPSAFRTWLANMAKPAAIPARSRAAEQLFMSRGCGGCHELRGTAAAGRVGPDLTHLASRSTLAAVTIPNTPRKLAEWIQDPQAIKPGNHMPDLGLSSSEAREIASFLEELR